MRPSLLFIMVATGLGQWQPATGGLVFAAGKRIFNVWVLWLAVAATPAYAAGAQPRELEIPAQDVSLSLNALAVQFDHSLIYSKQDLQGIAASPLTGSYTLQEALDVLLAGTPVRALVTAKRVIVISMAHSEQSITKGETMQKRTLTGILATLTTLFGAGAGAQEGGAAREDKAGFLEEIVVTGSGRGNLTALQTSYGITILNADDVSRNNPVGLADLVDAVPGLQGEFANGETNTNLNVRGTNGGFNAFISLQEDGLPVQYSPFFAEFELRHDLSYERVEAVLGGPSGVFTAQGAAATINYISRRPLKTEGEVGLAVTDYGQLRADFFYGGPLGDSDWSGAVGGFFRQGDAVRDTGYAASGGGQLRASLSKQFADGRLTFAYKKIDDQTPYFNPLPTDTRDPDKPRELPAFDARRDALAGPDVRVINSRRPGGEIVARDLSEGNVSKTDQFTVSVDYDFGNGFSVSEKMRFSDTRTIAHDFRGSNDGGLLEAEDYVAGQLNTLRDAFPQVASVRLVRVNDGQVIADPSALNGNGLLAIHDLIEYDRHTRNFINDLRVNWENERALLTLGLQSWRVDTRSSNPQDQFLIDVRANARRYNVQGLDGAGNVVANLTDAGVITHGSLDNHGGLETDSQNLYANIEYQLTDDIRIDAGARREWAEAIGFGEDLSFNVPIDGTQSNTILADNSRLMTRNGNIFTGRTKYRTRSWTLGGNWALTDNLAVYARYASAEDMGFVNEFSFYNIPAFGTAAGSNLRLSDTPTELTFSEIGVRYLGGRLSGYLTLFDTEHERAGSIVASATGAAQVLTFDTLARGIEFWLDVDVFDNLTVNVSGVLMDGERKSATRSFPINRVPETQIRLAPTWYLGNFELFANIQHYGKRNDAGGSEASLVTLPAYTQVDLGLGWQLSEGFNLRLQARNLTNTFGFTSANFRGPVPTRAVRYNSTIPGRNITLSANYRF